MTIVRISPALLQAQRRGTQRRRRAVKRFDWADTLRLHITAAKLPPPVAEHCFAKPRMWRFDLCWLEQMVAVEVEGGIFIQGRHSRASGMREDCVKYNEAVLRGWRLLRFTPDMVQSGFALELIQRALGFIPKL